MQIKTFAKIKSVKSLPDSLRICGFMRDISSESERLPMVRDFGISVEISSVHHFVKYAEMVAFL